MYKTIVAIAATLTLGLNAAPAPIAQSDEWTFSGVDRIELSGVSGDLHVEAGSGGQFVLRLEADVRPSGAFRPEVEQSGDTLVIREEFGRNSSGEVRWMLMVPASASPTIEMETASGDLTVEDVTARYDFESASGDVTFTGASILAGSDFSTASGDLMLRDTTVGENVKMSTASGDVELNGVQAAEDLEFSTASGDVDVIDSQGVLRGSTASGDVTVRSARLTGPSSFSSASGDVSMELSQAPDHDIELSSASGNVDFRAPFGNAFTLVMTAREDRGDIDAPFAYTSEERFERNDQWYERKTVEHGSGGPEIRLSTASGSIDVREGS